MVNKKQVNEFKKAYLELCEKHGLTMGSTFESNHVVFEWADGDSQYINNAQFGGRYSCDCDESNRDSYTGICACNGEL